MLCDDISYNHEARTVSCQLTVMSPDRKLSLAEKRTKFKKLLEDVDAADSKVLRLFPCQDFQGGTFGLQAKKGLKTALRTILVAAEDGYVNENELSKYGVGGDSRHRLLPRLLDRGLLTRSEEKSERGGKKFVYQLSAKGVVLCAAFPRILKSYLYVSLINNRVANRPLAYTMLTLYDADSIRKSGRNHLLEVLHFASDSGLNIEHVSEKDIAQRLLLEEEAMSTDPQETFLFKLCGELIDWASSANDDDIADVRKSVSDLLDLLRSKDPRNEPWLGVCSPKLLRDWGRCFSLCGPQIFRFGEDSHTRDGCGKSF